MPLEGYNLHVARGGYTGEDGFEAKLSAVFYEHIEANFELTDLNTTFTNGRSSQNIDEGSSAAHWSWGKG